MGVRKEGPRVDSSSAIGGLKLDLGKRNKYKVDGPRSLDSKHHSVVVIKENKDPNLQTGGSGMSTNGLGFTNLVPKSSFPDILKGQRPNDSMKSGGVSDGFRFGDKNNTISLDKAIFGIMQNLDGVGNRSREEGDLSQPVTIEGSSGDRNSLGCLNEVSDEEDGAIGMDAILN